jgi:hypothetical protein
MDYIKITAGQAKTVNASKVAILQPDPQHGVFTVLRNIGNYLPVDMDLGLCLHIHRFHRNAIGSDFVKFTCVRRRRQK